MTDETRLSEELSRRAHDVHGSTLTLDDVRGRARSIRRRRTGAVTGGIAAAVALVVLVPTVLSGGGPESDGVDPAPSPAGTSVLHRGTLTLPDGGTVALDVDNSDVNQLAVLTDGRIVLGMNQQPGVRVYGPDGTFQDEYVAGPTAIRTSPDHDAVVWIEGDGGVQVLESGADEPAELGTVEVDPYTGAMVDAVVDAGTVLVGNGNTTTTEVTANGVRPLRTSEPLRVTDVSPSGLWAVQYADDADPQFGCAGLYDPASSTMTARSCETSGLRFSPDGQHVLGGRGDNNMYSDAAVLDLDLQQVGGWSSARRGEVISRTAWADATHVLVAETSWETSTWTLARVDLTWTEREVLDGPAEGGNPEMMSEYVFSG